MNKKYDIVVFGASGFTGQLICDYLSSHKNTKNMNWAIAGRNQKKLDIIKNLMTYPTYQEYIGCEYFTDYIGIPQRQAVEAGITEQLLESVKKSTCKIFLIGAGVCKLKFYNKLKEQKNCVYIDVGHGLDAVAGIADNTRPYFGNWQNYKIRNYDYSNIDYCAGPSGRTGITL